MRHERVTNLDEAITVVAAMQHAGWRHVIGTLWSVWDSAAAAVTHNLYLHLMRDGGLDPTNAAHALHQTIREPHDTHPACPSTWGAVSGTRPVRGHRPAFTNATISSRLGR